MLIGMFARIIIFFHNVNMAFSHSYKVIVSVVVKMEAILFHYSVIALYFLLFIMIKYRMSGSLTF